VLLPVYLYFHGGGHLFGTIETEDASCSRIVASFSGPGVIVVNINYRHTPEFQHPTQINDAWDSFEWLASHISQLDGDPKQIVIGGISAGGGLAASIVLRESERVQSGQSSSGLLIRGQILCSPWLVHPRAKLYSTSKTSSYNQNQTAPILPWTAIKLFSELLGPKAVDDPYFNVLLTSDEKMKGMPKSGFLVAGQDLLRDEALHYAEKLKNNGYVYNSAYYLFIFPSLLTELIHSSTRVITKVHVFPGLPHGFRRYTELASTNRWEELIVLTIQWCLSTVSTSSLEVERK
jgi:acetyl esterase/lipase